MSYDYDDLTTTIHKLEKAMSGGSTVGPTLEDLQQTLNAYMDESYEKHNYFH